MDTVDPVGTAAPLTRGRRPRDRKRQLAAVAAELFRARGYHAVGINEIAAAAGVTGPAVYRHFSDKRSILAHVLLAGIEDMEQATAQALDGDGVPTPGQVERLLGTLARKSVERREAAALWRWEGRHLAEDARREIRRRSGAVIAAWAGVLRRVRPELSEADAELLCWAGMSVFGSVSVHRTSVAKKRFCDLLVRLGLRVLHVRLPEPNGEPAPPGPGLAAPSRREQVLAAATELFHRRGFHAVSMEDIGAAAGIAGPSVYRHFPSKTSLLTAICQRAAERLALGAEEALRTSAPPDEREALRRLTRSYVRTLTDTAELSVAFSGRATAVVDERDRTELIRVQRDYVAQWVRLLSAVHPALDAREAKITVHAALTIANDLTRTRRVRTRPRLPDELVTLMTAVLDID
ncbi:DNA-binding transcriptional regulator, AcrR family [Amycolatopsis arida]|uniref:DNA-binding transcriptional regulator, AcrR family n=1 Tax=Amycolatopsis arida TaxID=587909 RepID=A0A1I5LFV3_9PSEU|nr:TetR/AcrR family transcriptional regulator [Amycolatopsis arida]TDX93706.1 AcrR family transcriptional regulator [Amycolatopsis arida]SFO96087.1 DNA-binding transcriptional regulator, AcrR family [Amycolatopsis arida]